MAGVVRFCTSIDVSGSLATNGGPLTPAPFAWRAWHFQHLRLDLCGRCGTFCTSIDVSGSLATNGGPLTPAPFAWEAWHFQHLRLDLCGRCGTFCSVWQVWYVLYLHRCQWKLGDERGPIDAGTFRVAGVALSAPQAGFVWQVWYVLYLHRCQRKLGDERGPIDAGTFCVALSAPQAGFVWQVWYVLYLHRCHDLLIHNFWYCLLKIVVQLPCNCSILLIFRKNAVPAGLYTTNKTFESLS